jgi:hypothetical protein
MRRVALTVLLSASLAASAHGARKPAPKAVPKGASELIAKVAGFSAARDFAALRGVMTDQFTYDLGGDFTADSTVAIWRKDERYLRELGGVLKRPCRPREYDGLPAVECPGTGGLSFHAWFVETPRGWRFTAFMEGEGD